MEQTVVQNKLDWEKFKHHFHSSYWSKMKNIIESPELYEIYQELKNYSKTQKVVPYSDDVFKCFQVDLAKLKVFILGADPYPQVFNSIPAANGRSFCCEQYGRKSPSLEILHRAIENDLYKGLNLFWQKDHLSLKYLEDQGVMLANASLTTIRDKPGKMEGLWEPFWKLVFEQIFQYQNGLIMIGFGKSAEKIIVKYHTPFIHYTYFLEHPAFAARNNRDLEHKNCFSEVNKLLESNNGRGSEIKWLYEPHNDCPFA